jgi:hypothetical protein
MDLLHPSHGDQSHRSHWARFHPGIHTTLARIDHSTSDGYPFRRAGKRHTHAFHENRWLEAFWDLGVHHGAIPHDLDVFLEALMLTPPDHSANLACSATPVTKTSEDIEEDPGRVVRNEINESVPESKSGLKVKRQVHEVIATEETAGVQQSQKHGAVIAAW